MTDDERSGGWSGLGTAINVGASLVTLATANWAALLGLSAGLGVAFQFRNQFDPSAYIPATAVTLIAVGLVFSVGSTRRMLRLRQGDPNNEWRILSTLREVRIFSPQKIEYLHRIRAQALRNNAYVFEWRTGWTGTGTYEVVACNSNDKIAYTESQSAFGEKFSLILGDRVGAGKSRDIEFLIKTNGHQQQQKPFISADIKHQNWPRRENEIVIVPQQGVTLAKVWVEIFVGSRLWPDRETLEIINGRATYRFRGKFGRRYTVCWAYE